VHALGELEGASLLTITPTTDLDGQAYLSSSPLASVSVHALGDTSEVKQATASPSLAFIVQQALLTSTNTIESTDLLSLSVNVDLGGDGGLEALGSFALTINALADSRSMIKAAAALLFDETAAPHIMDNTGAIVSLAFALNALGSTILDTADVEHIGRLVQVLEVEGVLQRTVDNTGYIVQTEEAIAYLARFLEKDLYLDSEHDNTLGT
jgi:hypothetical protein